MNYEEFKKKLYMEIQKIYGENATVKIEKMLKPNAQNYEGLQIIKKPRDLIAPIINMEELYGIYIEKGFRIKQCVQWICELLDATKQDADLAEFSKSVRTWAGVKEEVYPMLLFTETNREYLETVVSMQMLDLSIVYMVSKKMRKREVYSVKITQGILKEYGITREQLHEQAVKNMRKEDYRFISMDTYAKLLLRFMGMDDKKWDESRHSPMYILINNSNINGAAGILDKELLKEFAGNNNYFIFLSCIHEAVFLPDNGELEREEINEMVADVYANAVEEEERLSSHFYYYNGTIGEIVME